MGLYFILLCSAGGTTFTKRKIMKTAEIQLFQRFFLYVLSAKICNLVQ